MMSTVKRYIKKALVNFINIYSSISGFEVPREPSLTSLYMSFGIWERDTKKMMKSIVSIGDTFVDVGAHVGYYTILCAKKVGSEGRVVAFDASPNNYSMLRTNTREFSNVETINSAVGEAKGTAEFFLSLVGSGRHSLLSNRCEENNVITVPVITLDDYFADYINKGRPIKLLKVDVEGAELEVFKGSKKLISAGLVRNIIFEVYPEFYKERMDELVSFIRYLSDDGYVLYDIDDMSEIHNITEWISSIPKLKNVLARKV